MITVQVQGEIGTLRVSDGVVESSSQVKTDALSVQALSKTSGNAFTIAGSTFLAWEKDVFEISSWMLCCIQEAQQERRLLLTLALKGNDLGYTMYPSRPNTTSYTQCQWL